MFTILIDTSAYEAHGLSFTGNIFDSLISLTEQEKIQIVTNVIINNEIEAHLKASVANAVNIFESACKKFDHNTKNNLGPITDLITDTSSLKDTIFNNRKSIMEDFFSDISVFNLGFSNVKINTLLEDYFDKKPPFGEGKKEAEFPDAIMLNSFIIENAQNLSQTCLVSSDPDWEKFSALYPEVHLFKSISELTDFINADYDAQFTQELKDALQQKASEFIQSVISEIKDYTDFDFDDQWYDPEAEIEQESIRVDIKDANILTYSETSAEWEVELNIAYTVDVTATDGESWYKDPDTKDIHYLGSNKFKIQVARTISVNIETIYESYSIVSSFEIEEFDLPQQTFDIHRRDDGIKITTISSWRDDYYDED